MPIPAFPIRVPPDLLVALGEHTGHFWSDFLHAILPSCSTNLHGSGSRNAWKAVRLRFPGSDEWLPDVYRSAPDRFWTTQPPQAPRDATRVTNQ